MRTLPLLIFVLVCLVLYIECKPSEGGDGTMMAGGEARVKRAPGGKKAGAAKKGGKAKRKTVRRIKKGGKGKKGKGFKRPKVNSFKAKAWKTKKMDGDRMKKWMKKSGTSEKRMKKMEALRKMRLERIKKRKNLSQKQQAKIAEAQKAASDVELVAPVEGPTSLADINKANGMSELLVDGDIQASSSQIDALASSMDEHGRFKRQATTVFSKWADNTVNYYIDDDINEQKRGVIASAIKIMQDSTCVTFKEDAEAQNRIKIFNGGGCYAGIGMQGGEQTLSLGDGCEIVGTAVHEFMHSLGIFHYQSRNDRDKFVTIDLNNVDADNAFNYDLESETANYTPYEFGSCMHYSANAFVTSPEKLAMVPSDVDYLWTMGNGRPTYYDLLLINEHHGCLNNIENKLDCANGGYTNPRNPEQCVCPVGYGGTLCDERPNMNCGDGGTGDTLQATEEWQELKISVGDDDPNKKIRTEMTECVYWIEAPQGKTVQLQITKLWNSQCGYGCEFAGIETKIKSDQKSKNPTFCCKPTQILTSAVNPTPIIPFNIYRVSEYTVKYRFIDGEPVGAQ